jgi:thiol peroxidase
MLSTIIKKHPGGIIHMSQERTGFTFKGKPVTLIGPELKVGDKAPNAALSVSFADQVQLSKYDGKVKLISVVPCLDTGTCDAQTRRFNEEAARLGDDVTILTISMDLPPAQSRWCGAAGIDKVIVISDYNMADFGQKYGVLVKELRLDMRAVFIIDKSNTIQYVEVLKELTEHPNYEAALIAVEKLI